MISMHLCHFLQHFIKMVNGQFSIVRQLPVEMNFVHVLNRKTSIAVMLDVLKVYLRANDSSGMILTQLFHLHCVRITTNVICSHTCIITKILVTFQCYINGVLQGCYILYVNLVWVCPSQRWCGETISLTLQSDILPNPRFGL